MSKSNSRRGFIKRVSLSSIASVSAGTLLAVPGEASTTPPAPQKFSYDLMVYGASSGGVIAAYTAKMYGLRVLLVEPGRHLGGLSSGGLGATDTGGKHDYCFRLCLTQNKANQLPLTSPENYNPDRYELLVRLLQKKPWTQLGKGNGFIISPMPNGKTDWNNYGLAGFSANYTGGSRDYPEADYALRKKIWNDHIDYQKGLLWFLATDERVPLHLRAEMNSWGFCRDEFLDTDGWSHQLYEREARRMIGEYVMTEHECVGNKPVTDGIAYGAYALDGHTCQRVVVNHQVQNEGNYYIYGFEPYLISYRSLAPKKAEVSNLLVPVCLSSSHAAFGSIRMEPVFMALGQVSGIAAYLSLKKKCTVQEINAGEITEQLVSNPLVNRKVPEGLAGKFVFKKI